ncbi:hypothetical protein E6C27_scaffold230G001580 [Cucumis melo var. makuwa]|uniref:Uncharacterized protein n=1 Tax=Cucumis melo var. makuwa TaxID=1194695 RepID=A0A5A7TU36_CUCMM|nr:hypothetical protein E6C27_scaffold230G001580 [Cucumis melo var. makuwa]
MALLFSLEGSSELTLEFSGLAVGLVGDSFLSLVTVQYVVKHWSGCGSWSLDGKGHTRLICASFGSTRLICASFGSTRLICAFYGTTKLLCRVGAQRGADRREAGRMREGHMDASGFLIASAMEISSCHCSYPILDLQPLFEELKELWNFGVRTYDSLTGWSNTKGYQACLKCMGDRSEGMKFSKRKLMNVVQMEFNYKT